jgi:hypothetical protein
MSDFGRNENCRCSLLRRLTEVAQLAGGGASGARVITAHERPRDVLSLLAEAPTVTLSLKFLFDCMKIILLICAGVPRSDQAENDTRSL